MKRGWWRRNRVALALVPVLLVLALAANGELAVEYWWPSKPRHQVGSGDGPIRLTTVTKDANGKHRVALDVSYVSTEQVTELSPSYQGEFLPELDVPASVRLWKITLHFAADPDTVILGGCTIGVLDAAGRDYDLGVRSLTDEPLDGYTCVPSDDPGPESAFSPGPVTPEEGLDGDADPRPPSWDYSTYVVMPKDRRPDRVRVWLELPRYAQFTTKTKQTS